MVRANLGQIAVTDITWTNTTVKLGDLQPWARNPRKSSKKQAAKMLESWDKFGQVQTIAISPTFQVLDGHQRLSALLTVHGKAYTVDARQASRELSEQEREQLVITLHTGAVGSWQWSELANWNADSLIEYGFDADALQTWNTDAASLSLLLDSEKAEVAEDPGPQLDRAAELQEHWKTELGQLWSLDSGKGYAHRLICGDCTDPAVVERVMGGERADFTFTDPPYNVGIKYGKETNDNQSKQDFIEWCRGWTPYLPERHLLTVGIKRLCWWDDILGDPQWIISWVKRNGQGQTGLGGTNKWDAILVYGVEQDHKTDMIELNNDYSEGIKTEGSHPTAKPVALWQQVIERFGGRVVYDPFSGSGTTGIACEQLGRKARMIEISPAYCAVILERFFDYAGVEPVLIE